MGGHDAGRDYYLACAARRSSPAMARYVWESHGASKLPRCKGPTDKHRLSLDKPKIGWIICLTYCDAGLNCWTILFASQHTACTWTSIRESKCCLHRLGMIQRSMTHAQAFRNFVKIVNLDGVRSACRNEAARGRLLVRHRGGVCVRSPMASPVLCLVLPPHFSLVCRSC